MSKFNEQADLEDEAPILKSIRMLCALTEYKLSSEKHVRQAFLLGLWYDAFPEYMLGNVEHAQWWDYSKGFSVEGQSAWESPYENLQKFQFISNTGDSWHKCYRDLRSRGWERLKVHREGGRLQYLLKHSQSDMPPGYRDIHLILDISIATCKQVQIGTEMKEVPIMKTVCEDLADLPEDSLISSGSVEVASAVVSQLIVVPDVEKVLQDSEPEPRCDHGNLSGCCAVSDCSYFMGHDDYEREHGPEGQIPRKSDFSDEIPF